jgi:hypothetical protein
VPQCPAARRVSVPGAAACDCGVQLDALPSATMPSSMVLIRCRRSELIPQDSGTAGR